jgi:hypothetical protein
MSGKFTKNAEVEIEVVNYKRYNKTPPTFIDENLTKKNSTCYIIQAFNSFRVTKNRKNVEGN